jgi:hypothetical protein
MFLKIECKNSKKRRQNHAVRELFTNNAEKLEENTVTTKACVKINFRKFVNSIFLK